MTLLTLLLFMFTTPDGSSGEGQAGRIPTKASVARVSKANHTLRVDFSGLIMAVRNDRELEKTTTLKMLFLELNSSAGGPHEPHLLVNLRHVDMEDSLDPDAVISGPEGDQYGTWLLSKKVIVFDGNTSESAPDLKLNRVRVGPARSRNHYAWLGDLSYGDKKGPIDPAAISTSSKPNHVLAHMELSHGRVRTRTLASDPKGLVPWKFRDDLQTETPKVRQPLAELMRWTTAFSKGAYLELRDFGAASGPKIHLKHDASVPAWIGISNLPHQFAHQSPDPYKIEHFKVYYDLLPTDDQPDPAKRRYPCGAKKKQACEDNLGEVDVPDWKPGVDGTLGIKPMRCVPATSWTK